jgi:hypothetical protein
VTYVFTVKLLAAFATSFPYATGYLTKKFLLRYNTNIQTTHHGWGQKLPSRADGSTESGLFWGWGFYSAPWDRWNTTLWNVASRQNDFWSD